ncbi:MAG: substrate-binding periplasmic protein [Coriobacteriia bacterium]
MRVRRIVAAMMAVALVASLAGCQKKVEEPTLTPTVEPPVIAEAGVLRVGVDLSYPPFAGTDKGVQAGIDIDVAAAIAERLGCRLEVVDVKPSAMASALNAPGSVDIMLAAVPITDAVLADLATAGSYIVDGPAFFTRASAESSQTAPITLEQSASLRIGAQRASASFWALEYEHGEGFVTGFDTLRGAFDALKAGDVDVVASSATVGAYIARDYPGIVFAGQFGDAEPLGVAVFKDAVELEAAVREALDGMAADGVLETIRRKWVGDLPQLSVPATPTAD